MLYPLSYEGLRPISYLAGDIHERPGVPADAPVAASVLVGGNPALTRPASPLVTASARC